MDFMQADTSAVLQTGRTTGDLAADILTNLSTLEGQVEGFLAGMSGYAADAFRQIFPQWAGEVRLVVQQVTGLGDATVAASHSYDLADETGQQYLNQAGAGVAAAINPV
jgi:WXG100 family type VII secretion target